MSHSGATAIKPKLKPVLSLKAVIAQARWIGAGESVSYGRTFTAEKPMMLATVCIGYADGMPRQISGKGGMCIIRGRKAPIVGRVCMDLLMVDVTGIGLVSPDDIVTLIGRDGSEAIRCEDVAESIGTITNDILSRLGARLPRVYV
jgi:serine/alanine racemase